MEEKYEHYAILDAQVKELTKQRDALKPEIIQDIISKGEDKAETSVGKFKIIPLKSWTYTDKVTELKELLDARKATEEEQEIATYEEKPSLRFTPIKL